MEISLSLVSILRDNPNFGARFAQKVKDVEKDKKTLLFHAQEYNKKFEQEIQEGTNKRKLMLTEGQSQGIKEEEINWGNKFLPTVRTPILNFLYFILREQSTDADKEIENLKESYHNQKGELEKDFYENKDIDTDFLYLLMNKSNLTNEEKEKARDSMNKMTGHIQDEYDAEKTEFKSLGEMDSVMFEQIGHELFKRLKKLKALSYSCNENESVLAHSKFVKLCKEYKINPDKVPYTGNETFD
jgi:hypothetical protein